MRTIGKFEILDLLGEGGMGSVFRARDPILDREVALKTIAPRLVSNPDSLARFKREAKAAARLQHPNIVTIYELGEVGDVLYIAMELLDGVDLARAMRRPGSLSPARKLRILIAVCRGLDYAHKHGVLHRDVKPANISLLADGSVKLLDFGIARLDDLAMTRTGVVLGTPHYMAPEMLRGERVDHRADMWAVGVVLYELLAGSRPFEGRSVHDLSEQILLSKPPALDVEALGQAAGLSAVLARALAKEPAERYRDLAEMADALEVLLGPTPSGERPGTEDARAGELARLVEQARRSLAAADLEGAWSATRRAQALDPSHAGVLALLGRLEGRPARSTAPTAAPAGPPPPPAAPGPAAPRRTVPARASQPQGRGAAPFKELAVFGEPPGTTTACLCAARELLAVSGTDGAVRLWDLRARGRPRLFRSELHQRSGHDAVGLCLAFSGDGRLLASGHADGSVHLWDVDAGSEAPVRLRHQGLVASLAFSPDGATLASGGTEASLKLWDLRAALAGEARRELHRQPSGVTAVAYAGDKGQLLVTGHAKAVLRLADARSGRLVATLRGPEGQVSLLVASPDGGSLAVASHDRTLRVYDLARRAQRFSAAAHRTKQTAGLAFFPDGRRLASVAQDHAVQLWDLETGSAAAALWGQAGESAVGVAVYRAGEQLAVALADGRVRLWATD